MEKDGIRKVLDVWESKNKILKPVEKELFLDVVDQMANLFAAGSYYYYVLNFQNLEMELVSNGISSVLGLAPDEFSVQKLLNIMHPEDIEKMHEKEAKATDFLFNQIPKEDIPLYKVVYLMRLRHTDGSYKTILHQVKTLVVSGGGKVQKVLGIHTDVSYLNMPIDHKISFISSSRPSFRALETSDKITRMENSCGDILSSREKEILGKMAEGKDFNQIAEDLFISPHTVNTHKKNILKKANCKNTTELVARCIREGVI